MPESGAVFGHFNDVATEIALADVWIQGLLPRMWAMNAVFSPLTDLAEAQASRILN
jgi:hypothetical protein